MQSLNQKTKSYIKPNINSYYKDETMFPTPCNELASFSAEQCKYIRENPLSWCIEKKGTKNVDEYILTNYNILHIFLRNHFRMVQRDSKKFYNKKKLCLISDIKKDEKVQLCMGYYYNTYLTNKIFQQCLVSDDKFCIYPPIHINQDKKDKEFLFSNEIGYSVLAVTSDGYLFIQRQGLGNDQSAHHLVPSSTSSADWSDFEKNKTVQEMIENASEKKFCGEINYSKRKRKSIISKTEMIGMFHWDTQGRKPEFVIYMQLNITMLDFNLIQSKNHNNFPTQYQFQIYKNNKFIRNEWEKSLAILKESTCSTQLYMCMKILENYLEEEKIIST